MSNEPPRLRLEEIDWSGSFSWLCLFGSFRAALRPQRMLAALVLVVLLNLVAQTIDAVSFTHINPSELSTTATSGGGGGGKSIGVLGAALQLKVDTIFRMAKAAAALSFGLDQLTGAASPQAGSPDTVVAAARDLLVTLPSLMIGHPWIFMFYLIPAMGLWAVFGGTIARMAALDAAEFRSGTDSSTQQPPPSADAGGLIECMRFALQRFSRLFMAPLFPWFFAGILAVLLLAGGFVLFNVMVLDIFGGLIFFVALLVGLAISMIVLLGAASGPLFYPAIAVEDADVFDAVSRAMGYVLAKPWRWLFYSVVTLVYGAITFLFVACVLFAAVWVTHRFVGAGVLGDNAFDLILPTPDFGTLTYALNPEANWHETLSGSLVWLWVMLTRALLPAFAISFYLTASTRIYLLLRRATDGNEMDDIYVGQPESDVNVLAGSKG